MATVHFPPPDVRVTYSGLAFARQELALSFQTVTIATITVQLVSRESGEIPNGSRALTESVKSLDYAPLLPKGVLVEAMAGEAVHVLQFSRARSPRHERQF